MARLGPQSVDHYTEYMKILVYPRADKNPYQQLLYGAMQVDFDTQVDYLEHTRNVLLFFPFIMIYKRLQGYKVFHLHWPSFYVAKSYPRSAFISFLLSKYCLYSIRLSGLQLIWTIHNALPHEVETSNDLHIAKYIARHAAAKIVHSRFVIREMKQLGLLTTKTHVIQHGNYANVYPSTASRKDARLKLRIVSNEFTILFFGLVRSYKGVGELLEDFEKLYIPHAKLLIVGQSDDPILTNRISKASEHSTVDFYPGFVADQDVAAYFKASDVVCLPFKALTTSGSALLALTFGKPIIAPRTGSLVDLPEEVGYFYDPKDSKGLVECLQQAATDNAALKARVTAAKAYTQTISWDKIAAQTYDVYKSVLVTH